MAKSSPKDPSAQPKKKASSPRPKAKSASRDDRSPIVDPMQNLMFLFVRHPPRDKAPADLKGMELILSTEEFLALKEKMKREDSWDLKGLLYRQCYAMFDKFGVPYKGRGVIDVIKEDGVEMGVEAVATFISHHRQNLYPPLWALDILAKAFKEYYFGNEKATLEKLLGFTKGKGQFPYLKEKGKQGLACLMSKDIFYLNYCCGYSIEHASEAVAEKYQRLIPEESEVEPLTSERIKDLYYKRYRKNCDTPSNRKQLDGFSQQEKTEFLDTFSFIPSPPHRRSPRSKA